MTQYEPTSGYIPFKSNLNYWFKGTQTTPDLRITSHSLYLDCSNRYNDCDKSRTGTRSVGLITWLKNTYMDDYREYLQVKLKKPLVPNKKTYVSIWISKERKAKLVSNNIGFLFSYNKVTKETEGPLEITPQLNCDSIINKDKQQWVQIKRSFIPDKPFRYFTIGNFYGNEKTDTLLFKNYTDWKGHPPYAYYLIDDIEIWQDADTLGTYTFNEKIIEPNKPFELPNILFEFNKAVLDRVSFGELEKLAEFLKKETSLKLNIHGHTDSKGNDDYNLKLSKKRAESVYLFLIKKGVEANRMQFEGFGETKPISETEDDKNRRVEFFISEK